MSLCVCVCAVGACHRVAGAKQLACAHVMFVIVIVTVTVAVAVAVLCGHGQVALWLPHAMCVGAKRTQQNRVWAPVGMGSWVAISSRAGLVMAASVLVAGLFSRDMVSAQEWVRKPIRPHATVALPAKPG